MLAEVGRGQSDVWHPGFDHGGNAVPAPVGANPPTVPVVNGQTVGFAQGMVFNALHANVIPKGPHQGHVLAWDHIHYPHEPNNEYTWEHQTRVIRYSIIDPNSNPPQFWNHVKLLPPGKGDLFCAGHAWNKDGDLLIVGGTKFHWIGSPAGGAKFAYVWEPPTAAQGQAHPGTWYDVWDANSNTAKELDHDRWYPSAVNLMPTGGLHADGIMVLGGTHVGTDVNSYQVWVPDNVLNPPHKGGRWHESGATPAGQFGLGDYPRAHCLTDNKVATCGFKVGSARVDHAAPGVWFNNSNAWTMSNTRLYGSSVLWPIKAGSISATANRICAVAGRDPTGSGTILSSAEICQAQIASPSWQALPSLNQQRWLLNTVLLPDTSILAIGGESVSQVLSQITTPSYTPEIYRGGAWQSQTPGTLPRDYHSCAVLLPNARVLTCGGENRKGFWPNPFPNSDYQVYEPLYGAPGTVPVPPVIQGQAAVGSAWSWAFGATYSFDVTSVGLSRMVERVCLVRPASLTHHAELNQRCVELEFEAVDAAGNGDPTVYANVPAMSAGLLPRGYYMLFVVTDDGIPSAAAWVNVQ